MKKKIIIDSSTSNDKTVLPVIKGLTFLKEEEPNRFARFLTLLQEHQKKKGSRDFVLPSTRFLQWFIGFVEGDGCFCIAKRGDLSIVISAGVDNYHILEQIQKKLGMGLLFKQGKRVYRWTVQSRDEVLLFIELFNGNLVLPSRKTKFKRFLSSWKDKNKKRETDQNVAALPANNSRREIIKPIVRRNNMLSFESLWLLGFVEAEGCFTISFLSSSTAFRTRFIVSQKGEENIPILSSLILLFGVGQIEGHSAKGNYCYIVSGLKNVQRLYPYFDKHLDDFLGIKKESYLKWKSLNEKIEKRFHLDKEKRKILSEQAKKICQISRKSK